jgi:hypothetical protein
MQAQPGVGTNISQGSGSTIGYPIKTPLVPGDKITELVLHLSTDSCVLSGKAPYSVQVQLWLNEQSQVTGAGGSAAAATEAANGWKVIDFTIELTPRPYESGNASGQFIQDIRLPCYAVVDQRLRYLTPVVVNPASGISIRGAAFVAFDRPDKPVV